MKQYFVKLLEGHKAKEDQILDGYLGYPNQLVPIMYSRGEAIKKARAFGGKIEPVANCIADVMTRMTIMTLPENALLDGVVKEMKSREAFKDATEMDEVIYQGDIFEEILGEEYEYKNIHGKFGISEKVIKQLEELAQLVDTDYVLVTKS